MYFTLFYDHLPYEKWVWSFISTNLNPPSPKDALFSDLFKIGPMVLEEKIYKFRQFIFDIS